MPAVPGPRQALHNRPRIGVVKFLGDGCQLTLLDLEDDLLAIADRVDIVEFAEATSARRGRSTSSSSKARSARRSRPRRSFVCVPPRPCW